MAADYGASTQHLHWEGGRFHAQDEDEDENGATDEAQSILLPRLSHLNYYIQQQIIKLGKRLSPQIRQVVLATAQVFVLRYYSRVPLRETNVYLVIATAIYLASKIEESPQHIRTVATGAKELWPDFVTADVSKLGEYEFKIISELDAQLIVHHPYRDLADIRESLSLTQDEYALCWSVVNDHYLTLSPLLYPPKVIAAAAVAIVVTVRPSQTSSHSRPGPKGGLNGGSSDGWGASSWEEQCESDKLSSWLTQEKFDMEVLAECTQSFLSLYKSLEDYNEWDCKDKVGQIVKALPQAKE